MLRRWTLRLAINWQRNRKETVNIVNNICSLPFVVVVFPLLFGLLKQFVIFRISFAYTSLTSPQSLALACRGGRVSFVALQWLLTGLGLWGLWVVRGGQVAEPGGVACIIRVVEHSRALKFTSFLAKTFSNFFKHPASRMYVRAVAARG